LAPLGLFAGGAGAWLALKLLSQKAGLWALIPPALEGFTPALVAMALAAWLHRRLHVAAIARRDATRPTLVLGSDEVRERLVARWRERGFRGVVRTYAEVDSSAHAIVLAQPPSSLTRTTLEELASQRVAGVPVMTAARFEEELFRWTPLATPDDPWLVLDEQLERRSPLYLGAKRALDVLLASLAITVLAVPFALLVALLATRGPVFYRQTRAGLYRHPFTLWKLRTMHVVAEPDGPALTTVDDPRITPIGRLLRKTRIDELPQLWNVLKGDMSLVGPRPERPELDQRFAPFIPYYALRHLARPGLTGWAQVRLGYVDSDDLALRRLEHDVYYLKRASLAFDLAILLATIPVVLGLRGR